MHLPPLIRDLAIILGLAGVVALVFRRIRQPVVVGYILAGILAGPHVPFFPTVTDMPNIRTLAELGVIFLLFSLGLEFSFRKLVGVGMASVVIALVEVAAMGALGYGVGQLSGWSRMDSLFLGGILSISSTTIIIKAIQEMNLKTRRFTEVVFAVLVVEDLVAILILISLSTIAVSREVQGLELLKSLGKLALFLPVGIVGGVIAVPYLFKKFRAWLSTESLLMVSVGLCLALVLLASTLGYSAALGAFIAGAILAETTEGKRIEAIVHPVRDLFGAIFFVSVGMLFDPNTLVAYLPMVILITVATIVGKLLSTTFGALLAGQGITTSVQTGFSLAQIGEFSFIIATLGASLQVTSDFLYPIAVSVALVTSFTTPYLIRWSDPFARWLEKRLAGPVTSALRRYELAIQRTSATGGWRATLRAGFRQALSRVWPSAENAEPQPAYPELTPWDAHLTRFEVAPGSPVSARSLRELDLRGRTGVNVVVIERGNAQLIAPGPDERLFPSDQIVVLGNDPQLQGFKDWVETTPSDQPVERPVYRLHHIPVRPGAPLAGRTIRKAEIRERHGGLVVGLERGGKRLLNPDSDSLLSAGDVIWVVCPDSSLKELSLLGESPAII